jgi:hypothetical protein
VVIRDGKEKELTLTAVEMKGWGSKTRKENDQKKSRTHAGLLEMVQSIKLDPLSQSQTRIGNQCG